MLKNKVYRFKEEKNKHRYTQSFEYIENEYALNKEKTKVIIVGSYDLREKLNSFKDTCLHVMLEKFLGNNIEIPNIKKRKLTFDDYDDVNQYVDSLRDKYHLSYEEFPTFDSIFNYIDSLKNSVSSNIEAMNNLKKSQNAIKEVVDNGKNEKETK